MENERKTTSLFDFISSSQKCMIALGLFLSALFWSRCECECGGSFWKRSKNGTLLRRLRSERIHYHYIQFWVRFFFWISLNSNQTDCKFFAFLCSSVGSRSIPTCFFFVGFFDIVFGFNYFPPTIPSHRLAVTKAMCFFVCMGSVEVEKHFSDLFSANGQTHDRYKR